MSRMVKWRGLFTWEVSVYAEWFLYLTVFQLTPPDYKETFPDIPFSELPCLAPAVNIVLAAEEEYERIRPSLQLGDCVDVWMLGVHPEYRRRNIAHLLTKVAIDYAFQKRFKYVILESTGSYSARCAEKVGMSAVVRKVRNCNVLPLRSEHHKNNCRCNCCMKCDRIMQTLKGL